MIARAICCMAALGCLAAGIGPLYADEGGAAAQPEQASRETVATVGEAAEAGAAQPEATPADATAEDADGTTNRPPELKLALDVTIVTAISVEALKRTVKDPRPDGSEYGFPSGDATLAFALARVASEYHPKQRTLWYLLAARVAWSRVKREAHDWQDVIAGAALGTWIGESAVRNGGVVLKSWEW